MIEVVYMAEAVFVPAGHAVADYHDYLKAVLNIPPDAEARVNGDRVGEEYVLNDGKTLEWIKKNGEKGLPWCTVTELCAAYKVSPKLARPALEKHAKLHRSCCVEVRDPMPNQPRTLFDEEQVKSAMKQVVEAARYKAPLCPQCGKRLKGGSNPSHSSVLKVCRRPLRG